MHFPSAVWDLFLRQNKLFVLENTLNNYISLLTLDTFIGRMVILDCSATLSATCSEIVTLVTHSVTVLSWEFFSPFTKCILPNIRPILSEFQCVHVSVWFQGLVQSCAQFVQYVTLIPKT